MRFCADENFPMLAVRALRERGHDIQAIAERRRQTIDAAILALAQSEDRIVLTFDKDFGELAFREGLPANAGVILFRLSLMGPSETARHLVEIIESRRDWAGHFSVVTDRGIRQRLLRKE